MPEVGKGKRSPSRATVALNEESRTSTAQWEVAQGRKAIGIQRQISKWAETILSHGKEEPPVHLVYINDGGPFYSGQY